MKRARSSGASISSSQLPCGRRHGGEACHRSNAVDVTGDEVSAQPIGEAQRQLQVHVAHAVEPARATQRLGRHVEVGRRPVDLDYRETAPVDGHAVADRHVGDVANADIDGDPHSVGMRFDVRDAPHCLHDAGEHQALAALTRATTRKSSPTRATSCSDSAMRSDRRAKGANSEMPRAGRR
jgi:hypothetical protein